MHEADSLEALLNYTSEKQATDLHLCAGSKPLIRVNGQLEEIPVADVMRPSPISYMLMPLLSDAQKETLAKKKELDFSFSRFGLGRFRVNIYSQRGTYAVAIRMLPFTVPEFSQLGLPASVETFAEKTRGLFLVTGATGSGKSTTLASLLNIINEKYNYHIITIEDPIEYLHLHKKSLVTQREIGGDANSFVAALRSALREDPDVIMLGEMRDAESINIALMAAETGHLVLSTLHTVGAAQSVDRMIDTFPANQQNQVRSQLAAVLEGIVSQHLIPRIDGKGLVAASEVLFVNPAVRNLIREGKHHQINSIIQTGQSQGMQLLENDLVRLCQSGIISEDDARIRANDQMLLNKHFDRR